MSAVLFQNVKYSWAGETNYAGGPSGTARSKTKITTSDTIYAFPLFKPGSTISLPLFKFERTQVAGSTLTGVARFRVISRKTLVEGTTEHFLMDTGLLNYIVQTPGGNPTTITIHVEDGQTNYEMYGCFIKQTEISIPEEEPVGLRFTWVAYDCITNANSLTNPLFDEATPVLRDRVSIAINSVPVIFKSAGFTIINNYTGQFTTTGYECLITNIEFTGNITTIFPTTAQYNALLGTTITKTNVTVNLGTLKTLNITNVEVYVESPEQVGVMDSAYREVTLRLQSTQNTQITLT